jgi:hypothetical protein
MSYRSNEDNGSFGTGLFTAIIILAAFICGYALRDSGFKVKVDLPEIPARGRPLISAPIQQEVRQ